MNTISAGGNTSGPSFPANTLILNSLPSIKSSINQCESSSPFNFSSKPGLHSNTDLSVIPREPSSHIGLTMYFLPGTSMPDWEGAYEFGLFMPAVFIDLLQMVLLVVRNIDSSELPE